MFNWCFIGAGNITCRVAKELVKSKTNCIFSIWNRTYEKAEKFAKEFGAIAYHTLEEALNDPHIDGFYIALTNDLHAEYMKKCIEHHKPVLCEKPFTGNRKEAEEVFELAKKNKVYVSEAMWTWHNKTAIQVREWLKEIGPIKSVECEFSFIGVSKEYVVNRLVDVNKYGGALLDIGVYGVRYSLELFGLPKEIECHGDISHGVDLSEEIVFSYDGFKVKHRFAVNDDYGSRYIIKGERGTIEVPTFQRAKKATLKTEKTSVVTDDSDLYEIQFSNVAKEIKDGLLESKFVTKENTLLCMALMDECRRQMGVVFPDEK